MDYFLQKYPEAIMCLVEKYENYEKSLLFINLENLNTRRASLCLKFAQSGIKYKKLDDLLPQNTKQNDMKTRENEKYKVQFSNTERLKNSMQNYLNDEERNAKIRKFG